MVGVPRPSLLLKAGGALPTVLKIEMSEPRNHRSHSDEKLEPEEVGRMLGVSRSRFKWASGIHCFAGRCVGKS
jgi:hypothetical protein